MRLAKWGDTSLLFVFAAFQQTHDLELAQPSPLQCDQLPQPCSKKPIDGNVGHQTLYSVMHILEAITFELFHRCTYQCVKSHQ